MSMEYVRLGNSGLKVSKIIFGGMSIGNKKWMDWDWVLEEEDALPLLKAAYDAGINTFDTANCYCHGASEELIGKFLKKYNIPRSKVVIMTKAFFGLEMGMYPADSPEFVNRRGLSRKNLFDSVKGSVERLGTFIDVLQIHRYDDNTPEEETMRALHDLVQSGDVQYIGASSMRPTQFASMQHVAEKNGWTKFISMQNFYNAVYREEERDMIPYCKQTGVGLIPWSPIAQGILTRPWGDSNTQRAQTELYKMFATALNAAGAIPDVLAAVEKVAKAHGKTMAQVAIAWTVAKGCMPIVGMSSAKRIQEAVDALTIQLSEEDLKLIEEPYKPIAVIGNEATW